MRQVKGQRRSSVEHEFAGNFGQFVPKRPLRRRKNLEVRRKMVHVHTRKMVRVTVCPKTVTATNSRNPRASNVVSAL